MQEIPVLNESQLLAALHQQKNPLFADCLAFYSSWFGGIVTDPRLMLLPMDDHMVHRGDGIFEAMKVVNHKIYLFDEHMARLLQSAEGIQLVLPFSLEQMKEIILATLKAANCKNAAVRIFVSRGPGSFAVNPYDTVGAQFYVVVTALKIPAEEKYQQGASLCKSTVPVKNAWMARVKTCNYLPNVMMKKEAVDRGFDFSINLDDHGFVAESATENVMMVDKDGVIVHPAFDYILKGTMMVRACELAEAAGMKVAARKVSLADLEAAQEIMMCGTTLDVLPVTKFEDRLIGDGKVGQLAPKLRQLLLHDQK